MDYDPDVDDPFRDDEDDPDAPFSLEKESSKEYVVYLVDASPKMFTTTCPATATTWDDEQKEKEESHFHIALSCISHSLKTRIITRSYDELAICLFNTRERNNLQDLSGVFVFNVPERDSLDRPTARLIKEFDHIQGSFALI